MILVPHRFLKNDDVIWTKNLVERHIFAPLNHNKQCRLLKKWLQLSKDNFFRDETHVLEILFVESERSCTDITIDKLVFSRV
jgi:hypothetical protein